MKATSSEGQNISRQRDGGRVREDHQLLRTPTLSRPLGSVDLSEGGVRTKTYYLEPVPLTRRTRKIDDGVATPTAEK